MNQDKYRLSPGTINDVLVRGGGEGDTPDLTFLVHKKVFILCAVIKHTISRPLHNTNFLPEI